MSNHIIAFAAEKVSDGVLMADSREGKQRVKSLDDALYFLLEDYDIPERNLKYIKVAWDLSALTEVLFRLLPHSARDKLAAGQNKVYVSPFNIFYIPYRVLGISYGRYDANIYNLRQYYPQNGAKATVNEAEDYGERLLIELQKMNLYPSKLTSPAGIYEECVLDHMSVPTIYDMAEEHYDAADYAYKVMGREWRQAFNEPDKKNWRYDMRAAYPSVAAQLLDTRRAEFIFSQTVPQNAQWGFMRGRVEMDAAIHPIIDEEGRSVPGVREDIITIKQATTIKQWGLGRFNIYDGWFLRFSNECRPLEAAMNRLFNQRGGNELREFLAKNLANASLGKFSEEHEDGKYGRHFNPLYSAIITSTIPCKDCDFIYSHGLQKDLVSVQVDGVEVNRKVDVPNKQEMGTWREKGTD